MVDFLEVERDDLRYIINYDSIVILGDNYYHLHYYFYESSAINIIDKMIKSKKVIIDAITGAMLLHHANIYKKYFGKINGIEEGEFLQMIYM